MKRILSILLCLMLTLGLLSGCGSDKAPMEMAPGAAADTDYGYSEKTESVSDSLTSGTSYELPSITDRKLVKTVYLSAETETFDVLMESLNQKISTLGGYVESRDLNTSRRQRCEMVIRIPAASLNGFVEHVNANANVTNSSESAKDVTLDYVDTEAKITALEVEQARLLELLASAESLDDILTIEARLSEVTYELERYSSQKRTYDNLVDYATVHLSVSEVEVLTPTEEPPVWQRITGGFTASVDEVATGLVDLFVWIIANSPHLVIWGGVISGVVVLVRRRGKKHVKAAAPAQTPPETP